MARDGVKVLNFRRFGNWLSEAQHASIRDDPHLDAVGRPCWCGQEQKRRGIRYRLAKIGPEGVTEVEESAVTRVTVTERNVTGALPTEGGNAVEVSQPEQGGPLTPAEKQRRYRERKRLERGDG